MTSVCTSQYSSAHSPPEQFTHLLVLEPDDLAERRQQLVPSSVGAKETGMALAVVQDNVVPDVELVWICVLGRQRYARMRMVTVLTFGCAPHTPKRPDSDTPRIARQ
jgi:hypothetical protein